MPCNSDYMNPNNKEKELQKSAGLLVWLWNELGIEPESWAVNEAADMYASDERAVTVLCDVLKGLDDSSLDRIVYNGRNKMARKLADWWDEHQEADRIRENKEALAETTKNLRRSGIARLSWAERVALGL